MINSSKSLYIFHNRCKDILQQLEVVDAALEVMQRELNDHGKPDEKLSTILKVSPKTYKALNIKTKQPSSILNRVRRNNQEFALRRLGSIVRTCFVYSTITIHYWLLVKRKVPCNIMKL